MLSQILAARRVKNKDTILHQTYIFSPFLTALLQEANYFNAFKKLHAGYFTYSSLKKQLLSGLQLGGVE